MQQYASGLRPASVVFRKKMWVWLLASVKIVSFQ